MSIGACIQAWRQARGVSTSALAKKAGLSTSTVEAIEADQTDPSIAVVASFARILGIPTPWIFEDPKHFELWRDDADGESGSTLPLDSPDPVTQQILQANRHDRTLFALLSALVQSGDPKLLRAAEVSLRSLVKQARQATVPWLSRPPGHFEPPSD